MGRRKRWVRIRIGGPKNGCATGTVPTLAGRPRRGINGPNIDVWIDDGRNVGGEDPGWISPPLSAVAIFVC